jgi:hypothetical protein
LCDVNGHKLPRLDPVGFLVLIGIIFRIFSISGCVIEPPWIGASVIDQVQRSGRIKVENRLISTKTDGTIETDGLTLPGLVREVSTGIEAPATEVTVIGSLP